MARGNLLEATPALWLEVSAGECINIDARRTKFRKTLKQTVISVSGDKHRISSPPLRRYLQVISGPLSFLFSIPGPEMCNNVAEHMAYCHEIVNETSFLFLAQEKRCVYTTPKSFLELISLYKQMLGVKRTFLVDKTERLVTGILKIKEASEQVLLPSTTE